MKVFPPQVPMFVTSGGGHSGLLGRGRAVCLRVSGCGGTSTTGDILESWLAPRLSAGDKGTGRQTHYDDVRRHQPPESAHIQRFHVAGGGEVLVQVTDKEWMCDR